MGWAGGHVAGAGGGGTVGAGTRCILVGGRSEDQWGKMGRYLGTDMIDDIRHRWFMSGNERRRLTRPSRKRSCLLRRTSRLTIYHSFQGYAAALSSKHYQHFMHSYAAHQTFGR